MKKAGVAILSIIYLCFTIGININMHYCMGKLADWGLSINNSKTCPKCGMEKKNGKDNNCCNDEYKFVKNNTDQKTTDTGVQLNQLTVFAVTDSYFNFLLNDFSSITEENPISHAPPQLHGVAIFIFEKSFLI